MYDYLLGGKTNYAPDREAAARAIEGWPDLPRAARYNRNFLHRVVRYLVREAGIRQFLDVGTGIPTPPNLHEVAQEEAPDTRVVYVDNDPIVLTHARALMNSAPEGRTAYVDGDLRRPQSILESEELRETLDMSQPVALTVVATAHFVTDEQDPFGAVKELMAALPSGSYLAMSHGTPDFNPEQIARVVAAYQAGGIDAQVRTHAEILPFFDGLELLDPGLVLITDWRPDSDLGRPRSEKAVSFYGGLARKR